MFNFIQVPASQTSGGTSSSSGQYPQNPSQPTYPGQLEIGSETLFRPPNQPSSVGSLGNAKPLPSYPSQSKPEVLPQPAYPGLSGTSSETMGQPNQPAAEIPTYPDQSGSETPRPIPPHYPETSEIPSRPGSQPMTSAPPPPISGQPNIESQPKPEVVQPYPGSSNIPSRPSSTGPYPTPQPYPETSESPPAQPENQANNLGAIPPTSIYPGQSGSGYPQQPWNPENKPRPPGNEVSFQPAYPQRPPSPPKPSVTPKPYPTSSEPGNQPSYQPDNRPTQSGNGIPSSPSYPGSSNPQIPKPSSTPRPYPNPSRPGNQQNFTGSRPPASSVPGQSGPSSFKPPLRPEQRPNNPVSGSPSSPSYPGQIGSETPRPIVMPPYPPSRPENQPNGPENGPNQPGNGFPSTSTYPGQFGSQTPRPVLVPQPHPSRPGYQPGSPENRPSSPYPGQSTPSSTGIPSKPDNNLSPPSTEISSPLSYPGQFGSQTTRPIQTPQLYPDTEKPGKRPNIPGNRPPSSSIPGQSGSAYPGLPSRPGDRPNIEENGYPPSPGYPSEFETQTPRPIQRPQPYPGTSSPGQSSETPSRPPNRPGTPDNGQSSFPGYPGQIGSQTPGPISMPYPTPSRPSSSSGNHPSYPSIPEQSYPSWPEKNTPAYPSSSDRPNKPESPLTTQSPFPGQLEPSTELDYPQPSYPGQSPIPARPEAPIQPSYPTNPNQENPSFPGSPPAPEGPGGPTGPIGGIGGEGGIGGNGEIGGVGSPGPDGPWPTGSPGPNGPFPGDPSFKPHFNPKPTFRNIPSINYGPFIQPKQPETYRMSFTPDITEQQFDDSGYIYGKPRNSFMTGHQPLSVSSAENSRAHENGLNIDQEHDGRNIHNDYNMLQRMMTDHSEDVNDFHLNEKFAFDHNNRTEQTEQKSRKTETFSDQADSLPYQRSTNDNSNCKLNTVTEKDENNEFLVSHKYESITDSQNPQFESGMSPVNFDRTSPEKDQLSLTAIGVQPPGSIKIKPITLPVGPNPEMCPCFIVESKNMTGTTPTTPSEQENKIPVYGQLAFIPVIFVPYCPGDELDGQGVMRTMFPSATPIPYPCNTCNNHQGNSINGGRILDLGQLGNIKAIRQVLNEANLGLLNVPVASTKIARSQSFRRKAKKKKNYIN